MSWSDVENLLSDALSARAASAVAAGVRTARDGEVFSFFGGRTRGDGDGVAIAPDARFDLASLTKVFATTTLIARLYDRGELSLDEDVRGAFPEFRWKDGKDTRLEGILLHQAGFQWWMDFSLASSPAEIFAAIAASEPAYAPRETVVYSDLGFILLGEYLARRFAKPYDRVVAAELDAILGTHAFTYRPLERGIPARKIVATEDVPARGGVLQGTVHDGNTARLGGVAAHAGLFGTLADGLRLTERWLASYAADTPFLSRRTARRFLKAYPARDGKVRALGWDVPTQPGSMAGSLVSDEAFGHSGYTGTSAWMDGAKGAVAVLLTNRVHPTDEKKAIAALRPAFHDGIWKELAV